MVPFASAGGRGGSTEEFPFMTGTSGLGEAGGGHFRSKWGIGAADWSGKTWRSGLAGAVLSRREIFFILPFPLYGMPFPLRNKRKWS
jgi:hypothetical protein